MISLQKKFLFIHVPKTGGNSIQNILKKYSEDKIVTLADHQDGLERFEIKNDKYGIHKHSTLTDYANKIEKELFNDLFKFSTIRNPWDMCVSFYFSPHRGNVQWNREEFKKFIQTVPTLSSYIKVESTIQKIKTKLNLIDKRNAKPLNSDIDFIMRFENLNEDFKKVCEKIDVPFENLPHRNKSSRDTYTKYYDDELIELVRHRFSEEIKYGSYIFGSK